MFKNVNGEFAQRGAQSVKNLDTLVNALQENKALDLIRVGSTGMDFVGVLVVENENYDNGIETKMVTWGLYDFADFTTDEKLNAFNNMSVQVQSMLGAYSNKFNV